MALDSFLFLGIMMSLVRAGNKLEFSQWILASLNWLSIAKKAEIV